jgi:phage/plasmid-like protein (TIGR03299 family)
MNIETIAKNFENIPTEELSKLLFERLQAGDQSALFAGNFGIPAGWNPDENKTNIPENTVDNTIEPAKMNLMNDNKSEVFGAITATVKIDEALEFGGIDYLVEQFPIFSDIVNEEGEEEGWQVPGYLGVRRADDHKNVFNILRDTYQIVQNRQVLEYIEPLLEATQGQFTRVGSLLKGARMFAFITLDDKVELPGGIKMSQDLGILTSHDGSHCLSIFITATLSDGTIVKKSKSFDLRHTLNVKIRMSAVVKIRKMKNEFFEELTNKVRDLTDREMSADEANTWLEKFLDFPEQKDVSVHHAKIAAKDGILSAFKNAVTGGNTRLAMALAVAHYRSHTAPAKSTKHFQSEAESRFRGVLIGTGVKELEKAWDELLKP